MEKNNNIFLMLFESFKKDPRSAFMAIMAIAIVYLWIDNAKLNNMLLNRSDEYKKEIVKELKRAYDPKFQEIQSSVSSTTERLDTSIQNVNNFIDNAEKKLNKKK